MRPSAPEATRQLFWDQAAERGGIIALEGGDIYTCDRFCHALCDDGLSAVDVIVFPHNPQALGRRQKRQPARRAAVFDVSYVEPDRRRA